VHGNGKSSRWTPIGGVWSHDDGVGHSITLDAPLTFRPGDRIVIRPIKDASVENAGV
jgi:hypothetical protein